MPAKLSQECSYCLNTQFYLELSQELCTILESHITNGDDVSGIWITSNICSF